MAKHKKSFILEAIHVFIEDLRKHYKAFLLFIPLFFIYPIVVVMVTITAVLSWNFVIDLFKVWAQRKLQKSVNGAPNNTPNPEPSPEPVLSPEPVQSPEPKETVNNRQSIYSPLPTIVRLANVSSDITPHPTQQVNFVNAILSNNVGNLLESISHGANINTPITQFHGASSNRRAGGNWLPIPMIGITSHFPPVYLAAESGYTEILKTLVEYGANVDCYVDSWYSRMKPLIAAAIGNHVDNIKLLLAAGASDRDIALLVAAKYKKQEAAQLLIVHGANVNFATKHGDTILHYFAGDNNVEMVQFLLQQGAKVDLKNREGLRAIDLAQNMNHTQVVKIIEQYSTENIIKRKVLQGFAISRLINKYADLITKNHSPKDLHHTLHGKMTENILKDNPLLNRVPSKVLSSAMHKGYLIERKRASNGQISVEQPNKEANKNMVISV